MKPNRKQNSSEQGTILMVTIIVTATVGLMLAGYLTLMSTQYRSTMRSLNWNTSIAVLEAGIEEGLTHANFNCLTNDFGGLGKWDPTADKWDDLGNNTYYKSNYVGNGAFYEAWLRWEGDERAPIITTRGYVPAPVAHLQSPGSKTLFGIANLLPSSQQMLVRAVRAPTYTAPLFNNVLFGDKGITLKGGTANTDSYDSTDPNKSSGGTLLPDGTYTDGKYDEAKAGDDGDVATNSGLNKSMWMGNSKVAGDLSVGDGALLTDAAYLGPGGSVGDSGWIANGEAGIQDGHGFADMNVEMLDVTVEFYTNMSVYTAPTNGTTKVTIAGVTYDNVFVTGNYKVNKLVGNTLIIGAPRIHVLGETTTSGNDALNISPDSTLVLYCGGDVNLSGNGVVNEGNCMDLQIYGLPTCKSISMGGNFMFMGVIYAPDADLHLSGGGGTGLDIFGAVICRSVEVSGGVHFSYDEGLRKIGPAAGFVLKSWDEVDPYTIDPLNF